MRIQRLSDCKIKLTVTTEDMERWGVSLENFVEDTPQARELFKILIKRAEIETGFSVDNARLMVEALPNKYDGIVLFVTNLDMQSVQSKKGRIRAKAIEENEETRIFEFDRFDDICDFVKNCENIFGGGAVYIYKEKYYLVTNKEINPLIFEYAKKIYDGKVSLSRLTEYGKCIIESEAISTIEEYFK